MIDSMEGQYKELVNEIFKHFDQAKDKKIHFPEFFGVLSTTKQLLSLLTIDLLFALNISFLNFLCHPKLS